MLLFNFIYLYIFEEKIVSCPIEYKKFHHIFERWEAGKDLTDAQLCTQLKQLRKETLTLTDSDLNKIRTVPDIYMLEI